MIGTIRKHSKWLWVIIAGLTIISFVVFMGSAPTQGGRGMMVGEYGSFYGKEIKPAAYFAAQRDFYLSYWMQNREFPTRNRMSELDIERQTYYRLLLSEKAAKLGIRVDNTAVVKAAGEVLLGLGQNGQRVPMQVFEERVLATQGLTVADFQHYLRSELAIRQLMQTLGLSGTLVTPQEASTLYDRENQLVNVQAVFFSSSNFLDKVTVTPAGVAQFYTNNMSAYREPDRVIVNYVAFEITNFMAAAQAELEKTNFTAMVDQIFTQYGMEQFPESKTPEEAKAKIRELLIRDRATAAATKQAKDFASHLFAMEPVKPENLLTAANANNLRVRVTAAFDEATGPAEISTPVFTRAAFKLTPDGPFGGPIVGMDTVYVIALAGQVPSLVPPLELIRPRVENDCKYYESVAAAQRAGTNFHFAASVKVASGGTLNEAALAAGLVPAHVPAFSLMTRDIPALPVGVNLSQLKGAVFNTPVGSLSQFAYTEDGGFLVLPTSKQPVDEVKKKAELDQFTAQVRRARQNEAFQIWVQAEANREFRNTPLNKREEAANKPAK